MEGEGLNCILIPFWSEHMARAFLNRIKDAGANCGALLLSMNDLEADLKPYTPHVYVGSDDRA